MKKLLFLIFMLSSSMVIFASDKYEVSDTYLSLNVPFEVCIEPPSIEEAKKEGLKPIDLMDAKKLYDKGAIFYDARDKIDFKHKKIKGAKHVVFDSSKATYIVLDLPKDKKKEIVFYCYGDSCAKSYEASLGVKKLGYENVYWFQSGFLKWYKSKYPMEEGK